MRRCHGIRNFMRVTLLSLILVLTAALPVSAAPLSRQISLHLDGIEQTLEHPPYLNADLRCLVSASDAVRLLGCRMERADSQQFELHRDGLFCSLRVGQQEAQWGNDIHRLHTPPTMIHDVIFVPLRDLAEYFGFAIVYDASAHTVQLFSPGVPIPNPPDPPPVLPPENLPVWGRWADIPAFREQWSQEVIIGSYYTTLLNSPAGRTFNIELSCRRIDGTIIEAGEIFSFNQSTGPRSPALGYQSAPVFVGKTVVPGVGGGVCQTSSTLYNAALDANLEIVQRFAHSLPVNYVAPELDATVAWGGADLQFRNNRPAAVKILARVWNQYVLCALAESN